MQILLVYSSKGSQIRSQRCPCPFTGIAMDLAEPIPISIPCPLMHAVTDRRVGWMAAPIALPLIGIKPRAAHGDVVGNPGVARTPIRVIADPEALFTRLPRHHTEDRGTIVGVGAVPFPLIGPPPRRVGGIGMGRAFFPPRSDTTHLPQRRCRSSPRSAQLRSGWPGCAAVGYGAVSVTALARARGAPWARLWQSRVAAAPRWPAVAEFSRRPSPSAACSSHRMPYSGRLGNALVHGTGAARSACTVGMSAIRVEVTFEPKGANTVIH